MRWGGGPGGVLAFARRQLFGPLGMTGVTLDFDDTGTPVGSTCMLAPARRVVHGSGCSILTMAWWADGASCRPDGFATARHPAPGPNMALASGPSVCDQAPIATKGGLPGIPKDAFMARGILGQYVIVVPSKNLVIVRLGSVMRPVAILTTRSGWAGSSLRSAIKATPRLRAKRDLLRVHSY
jgi:CubicO group peptidase (beta-lactamase class C family)